MQRYLAYRLSLLALLITSALGRQHALRLRNDSRISILCSTFSYDQGGTLTVEITEFPENLLEHAGFTLDRTSNAGIRSIVTSTPNTCLLSRNIMHMNIPNAYLIQLKAKGGVILLPAIDGIEVISSNTESSSNLRQVDNELESLLEPMSDYLQTFTDKSLIESQSSAMEILELISLDERLSLLSQKILQGSGAAESKMNKILLLLSSQEPKKIMLRHRRDASLITDPLPPPSNESKRDGLHERLSNVKDESEKKSSQKNRNVISENTPDISHTKSRENKIDDMNADEKEISPPDITLSRTSTVHFNHSQNREANSKKKEEKRMRVSRKLTPALSDLKTTRKELDENLLPEGERQGKISFTEKRAHSAKEEEIIDQSKKLKASTSNSQLKKEDFGLEQSDEHVDDEGDELPRKPLVDENKKVVIHQIPQELLSTINEASSNFLNKRYKFLPYVIKEGKVSINITFEFHSPEGSGTYDLFLHNCADTPLDTSIKITEKNAYGYLSSDEKPLPIFYSTFCLIYLLLSFIWFIYMKLSKAPVFRIHYVMLSLIIVKSISLAFHAINIYAIGKHGVAEEGWVIMYYIANVIRGFLFFLSVLLIGTGWNFFKHVFTRREKNVFIVILSLQILANIATIVIAESEIGATRFITWNEIFTVVDLICCAAILFPVIWSIRHLQKASQSDGKAVTNLRKLRLFRHFYVMVICYIYFTRIVVYLLRISVPYRMSWLTELFEQVVTLVFLTSVGYKFRPFNENPYLQVPTDEEEDTLMERFELEEAWTQSGLTDGVTRLHKPQNLQSSISSREARDFESSKHLLSPDDPLTEEDSDLNPLIRP